MDRMWGRSGQAAKGAGSGQLGEGAVVNGARASNDNARPHVVGLDVVLQVLLADGLDVGLGAQDGAPQAAAGVGRLVQEVKDHLLLIGGGVSGARGRGG